MSTPEKQAPITRKVRTPASPEEKAENPAMGRPRVPLHIRNNRDYRRRIGDLDPI